jgi:hypothetical protein
MHCLSTPTRPHPGRSSSDRPRSLTEPPVGRTSATKLARPEPIFRLAGQQHTRKTLPSRWATSAIRLTPVVLAFVVTLTLAVSVQAQGTGIFTGRVENGTPDGPAVGAGIPITLRVVQGDTQMNSLETTTDGDGGFRFEGLDTDTSLQHWPEATYSGIPYTSPDSFQFDDEGSPLEATITVYETTGDDSAVGLASVHFIAESFGAVLRISEIHLFENAGDRTYVGSAGEEGQLATVFVPLPENAVGLAFEPEASQERFVPVDGGFVDTEPVLPGQETSMLFFSYHLMVGGDKVPLQRSFAYPVANLNVLVAQPGLTLQSDQLEARGPESFQGRQYDFFGAQNLATDAPLNMEFVPVAEVAGNEGLEDPAAGELMNPAAGAVRGNQALLRWMGLGLVVLTVAGAVVYSVARGQPASTPSSSPDLVTDPQARRLLTELADLEEAFEAGEVDGTAYEQQRAHIRGALKSL